MMDAGVVPLSTSDYIMIVYMQPNIGHLWQTVVLIITSHVHVLWNNGFMR